MQFYDTNDIPADLAQSSFAAGVAYIMPNGGAPLFAFSGLAKKVTAKQMEHGYWSKTMIYPSVTTGGSETASGAGTITAVSTAQLRVGDVLRFQKAYAGTAQVHATLAENLLVTAINSSTEFVAERGFQGTTAAAIPAATQLIVIGSAFEQGSNAPASMSVLPARHVNYTQIVRDTWDATGTLIATQLEQGYGVIAENKKDCMSFHAQAVEKNAFFSKKSLTFKNGRPLSTMDGVEQLIYQHAPNNLYEAGSTTTFDQLETMLNPTLDYVTDAMNGNSRTIFTGSTGLQVINNIGRLSGVYQLMAGATEFGLQFKQFKTSRGTFNVIEHPLFNTNADWKKMAVVLDLSSIDFAYLEGRDTFHTDISTKTSSPNGRDAQAGVLTSELTLQLQNPMACGIIYNMRAAA